MLIKVLGVDNTTMFINLNHLVQAIENDRDKSLCLMLSNGSKFNCYIKMNPELKKYLQ